MSTPAILHATFADAEEAARIGRVAVDEGLAACVNIAGPCRSIYRWEGEIHAATEVAASFKTSADRAQLLAERIAALHGYDLPAIFWWPAEAPDAVVEWIDAAAR